MKLKVRSILSIMAASVLATEYTNAALEIKDESVVIVDQVRQQKLEAF